MQKHTLRQSGVLLHITSLPGKEGVGTLGKEAHLFLEALRNTGQQSWQILPIHPIDSVGSPFNGRSLFAGNPNLTDLASLVEIGDLPKASYDTYLGRWNKHKRETGANDYRADFDFLWSQKRNGILRKAHAGFQKNAPAKRKEAFETFSQENRDWLDDYCAFMTLKERHGWKTSWNDWSGSFKRKLPGFEKSLEKNTLNFYQYIQFVFDEQMQALRSKAKESGIELIGDLPIYPAYDSADVWGNQELFQLEKNGKMHWAAAVPPDYFSEKGQRWGYPLYRWGLIGTKNAHKRVYAWWLKRLRRELTYLDLVKLDHFRGFVAYGRVASKEKNALKARWIRGPGEEFFRYLRHSLTTLPLILEDLGVITKDVRSLRKQIGPGIKVFQFADFTSDPKNSNHAYLPHNQEKDPRCVYYTGTHDNQTLKQWLDSLIQTERANLKAYLSQSSEKGTNWQAIDVISASQAQRVIFPMQDILFLGKGARMNDPSQSSGQWRWRMTKKEFDRFSGESGAHLRSITQRHRRTSEKG